MKVFLGFFIATMLIFINAHVRRIADALERIEREKEKHGN
jgi:hypothetical protein